MNELRSLGSRAVVSISLLLMAWGGDARAQAIPKDEMRVHFIDVGQGDATLLEFSCGAVLIDTGGETNDEFESNDELSAYLEDFFQRRTDLKQRLDGLVLSHPHLDHTHGVPLVLQRFAPKNIVTNGQRTGSGKTGQLAAQKYAAASEGTEDPKDDVGYMEVDTGGIADGGLTNPVIDPVNCSEFDPRITVLWGRVPTSPGWSKTAFANANNHSVVARVDFGSASFLFTGDLETDGIKSLLERYKGTQLLDADVYKVGHHGASNATTAALLQAVTPKFAVLMNGPEERQVPWTAWAYGHPRKEIVQLMIPKVTEKRPAPSSVRVATGQKQFVSMNVSSAIYSTSWDGPVVLRAKADGTISVLGGAAASNLVDVNSATTSDLTEVPTLGPKRAGAIVTFRTEHGKFASVDALDDVPGIGPATIAAIREFVVARQ